MVGSVNKVILVGNLGQDPDVKSTNTGNKIVSMSIATSQSWIDKSSGDRKENTQWHKVVIFNDHLSKIVELYARKGTKVYVEGRLQTRKWTDQNGQERYTTEVVVERFRGELQVLSGGVKADESGSREGGSTGGRNASRASQDYQAPAGNQGDLDDEIPF